MLENYFGFDIAPYTSEAVYSAGDVINPEGSIMDKLIFLAQGTAKCVDTQENGVVNLIAYLQGPCFIGDLELVGARTWSSNVTAVTNCQAIVIDLHDCRDLVLNDVRFLKYLCTNFAQKTVRHSRNISRTKSYPLKNQLATFIIDMQNNGIYSIPHTESSSYLGVSYRHLLYVLTQFQQEGLITKTKSGYKITDMRGLEELYIHLFD